MLSPPDKPRLIPGPNDAAFIVDARLTLSEIASALKAKGLRLTARNLSVEVVRG